MDAKSVPRSALHGGSRPGLRLAFAYVAVFLWMGAYLPYWPVWLAHRGMSPTEIGVLLSVTPWTRVVASPLAGRWADRHGHANWLAMALSLVLMLALACFVFVSTFAGLLLIMIAVGISSAPIIPLIDGLTIAAEAEGAVRYGPVRLWGSAAFIAASWIGGELLELHGEAVVLWILVGAAAVTAVASALLPGGPGAPRAPALGGRSHSGASADHPPFSATAWPFVAFLAITSLLHASHAMLYAFGTQHWRAHGLSEGTVGLLWAESVLAEIVLFAMASRFDRWFTPHRMWLLAGASGVLRWAVLASTVALPSLVIVQALHALTYGALHLGAMAYIRQRVPMQARGQATTLYSAASAGLALGIALPLAGELYDGLGADAYWVMSGFSLLGALLALVSRNAGRAAPSSSS